MRKIILVLLVFSMFISRVYCFPDIEKFPYDIVNVSGSEAFSTKSKNFFKLSKTRFKGFDGYTGYCKMTGYKILIDGHDEESECVLWFNCGEEEKSYFSMEIDLDDCYKVRYFYFEKGRVVFVFGNGNFFAGWQKWIKNNKPEGENEKV